MQSGGAAANAPNAADFHAPGVPLGGEVFLRRSANGLGDDQGHGGTKDGDRQPTEAVAPAALANAHQGEEGHRAGKEGGCQQVGAAVRMDRKLVLPTTQPVEGMVYGRLQGFGWDISIQIEAPRIRAADHGRIGETGAQKMDGGVFEGVIAACAQQNGRGQELLGEIDRAPPEWGCRSLYLTTRRQHAPAATCFPGGG